MKQHTTRSEAQTATLAARLAVHLRPGDCAALAGPLGAGKSVFARSLIRTLAGDDALIVPSPTFTLVQTYTTPRGEVWHFDLWRVADPEEIWDLGWDEARAGIMLVEWPERAGHLLPARRWEVALGPLPGADDGRRICITETGPH